MVCFRPRSAARDVPSPPGAVERFILEVLPTVPGGPAEVTEFPGHSDTIRAAVRAKGLRDVAIDGTFVFYDGQFPIGAITGMLPSLTTSRAAAVCRSKDVTKQMLAAAGVPTPRGWVLGSDGLDAAIQRLDPARPLVLKPTLGSAGSGVVCGITTEAELREAWSEACRSSRENGSFVLEEHVAGVDVRVYVVGRNAVAAATRVPPYVIGDGQLDIERLLAAKSALRDRHAYLATKPIALDQAFLARSGRVVTDVPSDGEVVLLSEVANIHRGGENVDVTTLVHPDVARLAVDAVRAVPGLGVAGVDLLVPDVRSPEGAVVLELNSRASISVHHCPAHGVPRDVAGAIIDRMLETAG